MKVLIIDDEPFAAKYLEEMLKQHCFEVESTELINNPFAAIEKLKEESYDIIFLDIEMPEITGFELLQKVSLPSQTQIVFTTNHRDYAVEAFTVHAAHYLVKMIQKEELIDAVRKASYLSNKGVNNGKNEVVSVFEGEEHHILKQSDILWLAASGSYTKIVVEEREFLSTKSLGQYETILSNRDFIRCHNSYIINLNYVIKVGKGRSSYVVMKNNETIPISSFKKGAVIKMLGL